MNTIRARIAAVAVLGLTLTASAVQAGPPRRINARQAEQQRRIRQGIRSGQISPAERARIQAREAAVRRQEARYRLTHGRLSVAERRRLERELNQNRNVIYNSKHDYNYRHR